MKTLCTIAGVEVFLSDDGSALAYTAPAMIDDDGSGPAHGDPDEQPDTSLHVDGSPLDADVERYIVVPPQLIEGVKGIVLGCRAVIQNLMTRAMTEAVVGDIGPRDKIGEISIAAAKALGIDPSPTSGGMSQPIVNYWLYPGVPAQANGKVYPLQAEATS